MSLISVPNVNDQATEGDGNVIVFTQTKAEYRRALKSALDDMGITYRQLRAMARKNQFTSLRARRLWLLTKHSGSGW
jgi:hypothetical protein